MEQLKKVGGIICILLGIVTFGGLFYERPFIEVFLGVSIWGAGAYFLLRKPNTQKKSITNNINKTTKDVNSDLQHNDDVVNNLNNSSYDKTKDINKNIQSLKNLRDNDVFTEEEYQEKLKILKSKLEEAENKKSFEELKKTKDYKTLKKLKEDGILSQEEFNIKVNILKDKLINKPTGSAQIGGGFRITEDLVEGYYVIINDNLDYGYADRGKNVVIEPKYEYAFSFTDGLALVRLDGKFGFIDKNDNMVIPCIYDFATSFVQGKSKVTIGYESYYIDKYGDRIE